MMVTSRPAARRSMMTSRPKRPYPHITHRPSIGGRPRSGSAAPGPASSQVEQLVGRGSVQREPQVVAEPVERVDHRRGAEGLHPLGDRGRDGPRDDGQVRTQQRRRHGDGEVGLVVVGQREHAGAERMVESGGGEVVRVGASAARPGMSAW